MKYKPLIATSLAALVAGAIFVYYWHAKGHCPSSDATFAADACPDIPALVVTAQPAMRQFSLNVPWTGIVEPRASVSLVTQLAGRIAAQEAKDQAWIGKGQTIMRLGGPLIEVQRAKLEAEVGSFSSQLGLARQTVKRLKQNLKVRLAINNQVAAAQAAQLKLQSKLHGAQLNLKTFEKQVCISAPMSGIFTKRLVSVGQDVSAGQAVGEIIGTGHLRIVASLFPPADFDPQGKVATVRLGQEQVVSGIIRRLLPESNSTGALMVWIEGPQIDKQLRPGQTVGGFVVAGSSSEKLAVPESAIVYDSKEQPYLFVGKDGNYMPQPVRLGLRQGGWVEVLSGLKKDQPVVTKGAYELFHKEFSRQFKVKD